MASIVVDVFMDIFAYFSSVVVLFCCEVYVNCYVIAVLAEVLNLVYLHSALMQSVFIFMQCSVQIKIIVFLCWVKQQRFAESAYSEFQLFGISPSV